MNQPHRINQTSYISIVIRLCHWMAVIAIIGLFATGLYMVELDYYDNLYHYLPNLHRSFGIMLLFVVLFWLFWRLVTPAVQPLPTIKPWEKWLSTIVKIALLVLLIFVIFMGYLISTASGDAISVFGLFSIPATITTIENQADWAGKWHFYGAWAIIVLGSLHGLAALKHHFLDKDRTLIRMIKGR